MPKFQKKPVIVEARRFDGAPAADLELWLGEWFETWLPKEGRLAFRIAKSNGAEVVIRRGWWVIAEPDGSGFYPCSPEDFAATYDPAGQTRGSNAY